MEKMTETQQKLEEAITQANAYMQRFHEDGTPGRQFKHIVESLKEALLRNHELEQAVQQAISTTEFMHGCLTSPGYQYGYPEQTLNHLEEWKQLVPERKLCFHSYYADDCESCQERISELQQPEIIADIFTGAPKILN